MSLKDSSLEKNLENLKASRLLVICVDRDDDVGEKAGVLTPVVGRNACIEAAQKLALADPEDADANSIFFAIKTYEDLARKGYQVEVIVVAGVGDRGVQADEKIVREVKSVLEKFSANGAVIISDGEDDESVIPIIQNVIPIVSVQRVVMKVSRSVEYSYAVFGKYLKMIAYDSKYSKFFLGVPGILLLIGGIGAIFGYTQQIFAVLISILGGAFLIRAFDVDRAWSTWSKPTPAGLIRMFTVVTGTIIILASVLSGFSAIHTNILDPKILGSGIPNILADRVTLGQFIAGALPFLWMGIGSIFGGILLSNWLKGSLRRITDVLRLIVLISLYPTIYQFTNLLIFDENSFTLIPPFLAGLAITLISATLLFRKYRKKKGGEVLTE
ncbi:MAG: rane protein [Candidatus Nitrosotenuis sp.]|nr:rane protein [Candidatus Nitrosotenuis sp.]